jgi:hypothetical protein
MHPDSPQPDVPWRLEVELGERLRFDRKTAWGARHLGQLEFIVESERIAGDVTVSGSGMTVFAYGSTASGLQSADRAIRKALITDGRTARIRASRWDETSEAWQGFDPVFVPGYESAPVAPAPPQRVVSRTLESSAGRLVSSAYQNDVKAYARQYEIECHVIATPGLFRTRLEITLTGPEERVNDAVAYIRMLGKSSNRVDPGVIPYGGF